MKKFLFRLLCFSLPLLVAMGALEAWLESAPNVARDKHRWMTEHSRAVGTLVLGHSHNFYGIRPEFLGPGGYNLALPSQTYRYDYCLLTHYPMDALRTVILNYDYFQLWEDFERQPDERFQAMRYRIYMDCDVHPRLSWYGFEVLCPPLVRKKLLDSGEAQAAHCDSLGWGTEYSLESRPADWDNGALRAEGNTRHDSTITLLNEQILDSLFAHCRRRAIRVVMVNTPTTPLFRRHEDPRQLALNRRVLANLLRRNPEVTFLDYEADSAFTADDFFDADHLNQYGAKKLTLMLRDTLNSLPCSSTR